MHLYIRPIDRGEPHPPGQGGFRAEGLPVHEVAPAADGLPQHEAHDAEVRHGPQPDVLPFAVEERHEEDRDDGAVDGKPPVPDGDDAAVRAPVEASVGVSEPVQVEEHVIGPGPQDADGHAHQHEIQQVVLPDAVVPGLLQAQQHAEEQAQPQNDAIPVDAVTNVQRYGVGGELPVPEKAGKADRGVCQDVSIRDGHALFPSFPCCSPGRIRERAMRSSLTFSRRNARISS